MITVSESPDTQETTFTISHENGAIETIRITCSRLKVNDVDTYVFRNAKMRLLMKPSCFLTDEYRYDARNTALQAVCAIKSVESFCAILGTEFEALSYDQAKAYMHFLRGTLADGITYRFQLLSQRSENTVGAYLKHLRRYARWMGAGNSPFLQTKQSRLMKEALHFSPTEGTHRLRADTARQLEAPRYISLEEYTKVLSVINAKWSIEERVIVRLMFEHGLRIGEVLGLTTEDMEWVKRGDGSSQYAVVLRNRNSDRNDQHAKTLMRITSSKQYKSSDYRRRNVGFQRVYLSEDLFFQIAEYMETAFPEDDSPCPENAADSVTGEECNRYLFINCKGRPLSSNLWNKRLRSILADADILTDKVSRRTNLNHRFRHGYAMFLSHIAKVNGHPLDNFTIMTLMRHKSIESTAVYQRPTQEDIREMQEVIIGSFEEELYAHRSD